MTDAYIVDADRTSRGRRKSNGRLHETTPIKFVTQTLEVLRDRKDLDTSGPRFEVSASLRQRAEQGKMFYSQVDPQRHRTAA